MTIFFLMGKLLINAHGKCSQNEDTYCKYCGDTYGQFNTAHYLIECPITSKNCQYIREMLNDDELDLDITSQGDILRTRLYQDPQLLLEAIASRPPTIRSYS